MIGSLRFCLKRSAESTLGSFSRNYFYAASSITSQLLRPELLYNQQTRTAKRKGFRIKRAQELLKRARARKKEPPRKKKPFLFDKGIARLMIQRFNDSDKPMPPRDDVFFENDFRKHSFSLEEILHMHQETHAADMYDDEDALVSIRVECNMKTKKKTKFMEAFSSTITMPHPFPLERKTRILAIAKTVEEQEAAKLAGAFIVGGQELIKNIKTGLVSSVEYDHLVCSTEMLIPLTEVRGMLGAQFPNRLKGNFGTDIVELTRKFLLGYDYTCKKNDIENDFGYIDICIGRLLMSSEEIKENVLALLEDAERYRIPESPGQFPQRIWVSSLPSNERFLLKFWNFSDKYKDLYEIKESTEDIRYINVQPDVHPANSKAV